MPDDGNNKERTGATFRRVARPWRARQEPPTSGLRIRRILGLRPEGLAYWRAVHDGSNVAPGQRRWLWLLVCEALRVPCRLTGRGNRVRLYVPALYEDRVRRELTEVAAEGATRRVLAAIPAYDNAQYAALFFVALMFWHGLVSRWWGGDPFGGLWPEGWSQAGALDMYRVLAHGEWARTVTALTLHAGSEHLFSNIVFGLPMLVLLFRRAGVGLGLALTIGGGAIGNVLNLFWRVSFHESLVVSLGFSTALFAAVGALSGLMAASALYEQHTRGRRAAWRTSIVYMAAGLALLAAMGGGDGETLPNAGRTDTVGHVAGWFAGAGLGVATAVLTSWYTTRYGAVPLWFERTLGGLALLVLPLAWFVRL